MRASKKPAERKIWPGAGALAALCLACFALAGARAQTEPRPVGDFADRIDRLSRFQMQGPEYGPRDMPAPRAATLAASERRLGASVERMSFGARDFPVRREEVVGVDLNPASLERARALGFEPVRAWRLESLDIRVDVLRAPRGQSVRRALRRLRRGDPDGAYYPNAMFELQEGAAVARPLLPIAAGLADDGRAVGLVGVIDTGVDPDIEELAGAILAQQNFGRGERTTPRAHGAAVAALARRHGAGRLLVADVFSGEPAFADVEAVVRALDWMAGKGVPVVNMSLAGPPNGLLERAVARALARGHVVVAAVGNQGPEAPPQYPAAYPGVIGVTAVDRESRIYERANRGEGVDVSAVGVGVVPPQAQGTDERLAGTSYAAPVVSAWLARRLDEPRAGAAEQMRALVMAAAIDLGEPGFDLVYGAGLLAEDAYLAAGANRPALQ
ncbi:S8 family serine peptidase [Amphiplicatus metriothermophilus]|uniref:Subtilase family protein n=1 Tax=Amphiplicatus metriothermophilus TaxID=1519374 RepID=A0A239PQ94_9PROT|nr:S8 family serine peptidase [Amphiplicatus metriothermophilus]MBB5518390.1 hypothetical protein [Amphiplicatus metriothermophilus]SNT72445.1 Subtilase family protein [Amphiplicatus metriothermophilus]